MEESDGKWLWEVSAIEHIAEICHQSNTLLVAYHLTLDSHTPLQEHHVSQALLHLYRKVPCLRACYGKRDGALWLRQVTKLDTGIDFKVLPENELEKVMDCMRTYHFNSFSGPLWCARLVQETSKSDDAQFSHTAHLFLGFHHGIVDGVTVMKTCGYLVSILDDVIAGEVIDEEEQLGVHTSAEETDKLVQDRREKISSNPELMQKWTKEMELRDNWKTLLKEMHQPEGGEEQSLHVLKEMDKETTGKFISRCQSEGVTVHSGFSAAAHWALVDVVSRNGIDQDIYSIYVCHVVNVRRYWQSDVSRALGCHLAITLSLYTDVPRDINKDKFWDFARLVHSDIQSNLKSGKLLDDAGFCALNPGLLSLDDFLDFPLPPDFSLSNMGDVTALVATGKERHVRVSNLYRSVSLHNRDSTCSFLFHTFRGRLISVLDYNTRFISTHTAQAYADGVFNLLAEVI